MPEGKRWDFEFDSFFWKQICLVNAAKFGGNASAVKLCVIYGVGRWIMHNIHQTERVKLELKNWPTCKKFMEVVQSMQTFQSILIFCDSDHSA